MFKKLNAGIFSLILAGLIAVSTHAIAEEQSTSAVDYNKLYDELMDQTAQIAANPWSHLVGVFGILIPFLAVTAVIICPLYFRHKREMAMIEKGLSPRTPSLLNTLKSGIIYTAVGLGITIVLLVTRVKGLQLLFGVIPLSVGIGLIIYYVVIKKEGN